MEYLMPIELIRSQLRQAQAAVIFLVVLLGICLIAVPRIAALGSPILVQTDLGSHLATVEPWKVSIARMEGFAKAYLNSRFDWSDANFVAKRDQLQDIMEETPFAKLKESLSTFEAIARDQKARSYFILEQIQFANDEETILLRITRVLRIKNAALATPLTVTLKYENAAITEKNPYGLIITAVQEVENETH